jgi:hypothetical protein
METFEANTTFNFDTISLANPQPVQGGSFFTRATIDEDKPLYIQFPKCFTKSGIVNTKRGKYSDLLYEKNNQEQLIEWALALEKTCQQKIFEKKNTWFHNELALDDIETMMTPIFRLYRSGSKLLIRSYIDVSQHNNIDKCLAYNETKLQISLDKINEDTPIIPLVLIEGIKFSTKSFEIVIKLVQLMVLDKLEDHSQVCLIKHDINPIQDVTLGQNNDDNNSTSDISNVSETNIKKEIPETENIKTDELENNDELIKQNKDNNEMSAEDKSLEKMEALEHIVEVVDDKNTISSIEEIDITVDDNTETLNLKKPNDVYYDIYKAAREKAKHMRKVAIEAFLEAKDIKTKYMLDEIDDSDEEEYNIEISNN